MYTCTHTQQRESTSLPESYVHVLESIPKHIHTHTNGYVCTYQGNKGVVNVTAALVTRQSNVRR